MKRFLSITLTLAAVTVVVIPIPVLGQIFIEPIPKPLQDRGTSKEWLITGIFLVACLVAAFKPAKRAAIK